MMRLNDILSKVQAYHPAADLTLIQRVYEFAAKAHDGQLRRSGDPYVVHPLGVAATIADLKLDVPSVCAGLLHDCVEDTSATTDDISKTFGAEIAFLVDGITDGGLSDAQVGALAMAFFLQGLDAQERLALTTAMRDSGSVLDWDLGKPVVDKHSTGGVGDKVSVMLAPILAACDVAVPMISGRGLGHTGGTLDKLDSIPG